MTCGWQQGRWQPPACTEGEGCRVSLEIQIPAMMLTSSFPWLVLETLKDPTVM